MPLYDPLAFKKKQTSTSDYIQGARKLLNFHRLDLLFPFQCIYSYDAHAVK